jgi:hypothetical protein
VYAIITNTFYGNVGFLKILTVFSVEPTPLSNHILPSQHHRLLQINGGAAVVQVCFQFLVERAGDVVVGRGVEVSMGGLTEAGGNFGGRKVVVN